MQSQTNTQEPLSYNGAFVYPPIVPGSATPGFAQNATPYYTAQSFTQHGPTPVPVGPGIGQVPAPQGPQPQIRGGYMMPSVQYDNVGQGGTNYTRAGYGFAANQFPDPPASLSPPLSGPSGAHTAPNNQGPFPVWRLSSGWVSYAVEDELHVTIALKRIPSA